MAIWQRIKDKLSAPATGKDLESDWNYEKTGSYESVADGDAQVLAQLRAAGCDLSKPRHVINYLFFATPELAQRAADSLRAHQYETEAYQSQAETMSYVVRAERTGIVDESHVHAERALMDSVAEKFGGEYDGWEAAQG